MDKKIEEKQPMLQIHPKHSGLSETIYLNSNKGQWFRSIQLVFLEKTYPLCNTTAKNKNKKCHS